MRFLPYTSNILISLTAGSNLNLNRHINNTWGKKKNHTSFSITISINTETLFEAINQRSCFPDSFLYLGYGQNCVQGAQTKDHSFCPFPGGSKMFLLPWRYKVLLRECIFNKQGFSRFSLFGISSFLPYPWHFLTQCAHTQ